MHATRSTIAARRSTSARKHVAISGVTTSVDGLFDLAIIARLDSQKAIDVAVRAARSVGWSWTQISAALGGIPNEEALRRRFGF